MKCFIVTSKNNTISILLKHKYCIGPKIYFVSFLIKIILGFTLGSEPIDSPTNRIVLLYIRNLSKKKSKYF